MKYLKLSLRSLLRFKAYTAINLCGLMLCLLSVFTLVRYIHQEKSVDHFIPDLEYLSLSYSFEENNDRCYYVDLGQTQESESMEKDVRIERKSTFILNEQLPIEVDHQKYMADMLLVEDSTFLSMVPIPALKGQCRVSRPGEALVNEAYASRIFGKEDPVGKKLEAAGKEWTIVGVLKQPATKFSIAYDFILCTPLDTWSRIPYTLVRTTRPEDVEFLNKKYVKWVTRKDFGVSFLYRLKPLKEVYMDNSIRKTSMHVQGNADELRLLGFVTFLILAVGLFNYINLYSVLMIKRYRGLAVKKIFGASQKTLFLQLYLENFFLNAIALFGVWVLMEWTSRLLESAFMISIQPHPRFDVLLSAFVLFVLPLLTMAYTLIRLHRQPLAVSMRPATRGGRSLLSQMSFLFAQYVITFGLVVAAVYMTYHLYYLFSADTGYKTENVLSCKFWGEPTSYSMEGYETYKKQTDAGMPVLKKELEENPLFTGSVYGGTPYRLSDTSGKNANGESHPVYVCFSTPDYMDFFQFQFVDGRSWNSEDQFTQYKGIVNESLLKTFGIKDWRTEKVQLANRLWYATSEDRNTNPPYEIVGVVKDFKFGKLSDRTYPMMFVFMEGGDPRDDLYVSFAPGKKKEAVAALKAIHTKLTGVEDLQYSLLEDEIAQLHEADFRLMRVIITFALIGILISMMGLFGLSLFDIRQRYKEVALRKINGAHTKDIFRLLLRKYLYVLLMAFAVGSVIIYIALSKYMEDIACKAPLSPWIFFVAAVLVALISLLTLYWQVNRAARINPAEVIKSE